jgi:hypothetical protein
MTGAFTGPGEPEPGSSLLAVDGAAANDVWAVGESHRGAGERSLVERWDGSSWTVIDTPNVGRLLDVSVLSPDAVWAVSDSTVIHWDGTGWDVTNLSQGNARSLQSVSANAENDVWVAGERPTIKLGPHLEGWATLVMHFDGRSWSEAKTPNQGTRDNLLKAVEALGPGDVWAGGYSSDLHGPEATPLALHWNGHKWEVVPTPSPSRSLNVVWGIGQGSSTVWLVGHYRGGDGHLTPLILKWTGGSWEQLPMHRSRHWSATAASGSSLSRTWVVGSEPTSSFAIASCGPSSCGTQSAPDDTYDHQATGVFAVSETNAWLVGSRTAPDGTLTPLVQHWDGTSWSSVEVPTGLPEAPSPSAIG